MTKARVRQMSDGSAVPSRKDRKRAEIVSIAQELFFREGYAGASMSQIAAAVGGSKTTLYNYFASKEELLLAVVQDVVEPRPEDYDPSTMPSEFRAWLAWFGRATAKKITSYKYVSLQRLAAGEAIRFPEIGRMFYEVGVMPGMLMIAPSFAAAMDQGVLRRADPQVAAEQFLELCLGWTLRRVIWNIQPPPTDAEIEENVREAVSAFMDGYAPRREAPARKR
jgi:TetR/AcrR family transcriptional repressor of mexJK operon